jgi:hypothetical protein
MPALQHLPAPWWRCLANGYFLPCLFHEGFAYTTATNTFNIRHERSARMGVTNTFFIRTHSVPTACDASGPKSHEIETLVPIAPAKPS